ncbi:MAG: hypothetical protein AB7N76_27780 [Planctomycetota bacterium]
MEKDLDHAPVPLLLLALCAALPTLGLSLLVLWAWVILPTARAPRDEDLFVELRRYAELALPIALVMTGWGVVLWQLKESGLGAVPQREPLPLEALTAVLGVLSTGFACGLAFVLRMILARE